MIEKSFGMIKPEGLQYSDDIEARILAIGLEIEAKKETVLTGDQFEKMYGHAKDNISDVYGDLKEYMTSNPVVILCVAGEDARQRLMELRGSSNAAEAEVGTIRGDYAKDQDYRTLYAGGNFAKNVFHAADVHEAGEMLKILFGGQE